MRHPSLIIVSDQQSVLNSLNWALEPKDLEIALFRDEFEALNWLNSISISGNDSQLLLVCPWKTETFGCALIQYYKNQHPKLPVLVASPKQQSELFEDLEKLPGVRLMTGVSELYRIKLEVTRYLKLWQINKSFLSQPSDG